MRDTVFCPGVTVKPVAMRCTAVITADRPQAMPPKETIVSVATALVLRDHLLEIP